MSDPTPVALARRFHEAYERLAPEFDYRTREASAKPWEDVPEQNRLLMVAVCDEILHDLRRPTVTADMVCEVWEVLLPRLVAGSYSDAADAFNRLLAEQGGEGWVEQDGYVDMEEAERATRRTRRLHDDP